MKNIFILSKRIPPLVAKCSSLYLKILTYCYFAIYFTMVLTYDDLQILNVKLCYSTHF